MHRHTNTSFHKIVPFPLTKILCVTIVHFNISLFAQVEFAPDLCSRVTFVNFTVTRGSLQTQCLNQVLKAERPDVDAKRSDLLKLQGVLILSGWVDV